LLLSHRGDDRKNATAKRDGPTSSSHTPQSWSCSISHYGSLCMVMKIRTTG
jgi:hypothetical protein